MTFPLELLQEQLRVKKTCTRGNGHCLLSDLQTPPIADWLNEKLAEVDGHGRTQKTERKAPGGFLRVGS